VGRRTERDPDPGKTQPHLRFPHRACAGSVRGRVTCAQALIRTGTMMRGALGEGDPMPEPDRTEAALNRWILLTPSRDALSAKSSTTVAGLGGDHADLFSLAIPSRRLLPSAEGTLG